MLLHEFTDAVANKYFLKKKFISVTALGSMQYLIKKNLLPGEGYIERDGQKKQTLLIEKFQKLILRIQRIS